MNLYLTFDDGRIDSYGAFQIMKKYGVKGTFYITTGFIDGSFQTDCFGINRKPLSLSNLVEMKEEGMEIASHGDKHITETEDFKKSISKLDNWGLYNNKVGFSVPNSSYFQKELSDFVNQNHELAYIRVGRHPNCYRLFSKICYVFYNLLRFQLFYNFFNKHNLMNADETSIIYSSVVKRRTKAKSIINFLNKNKNKNCYYVLMIHSIVDNPSNKWEWSKKEFEKLCEYCKNNKIANSTLIERVLNG